MALFLWMNEMFENEQNLWWMMVFSEKNEHVLSFIRKVGSFFKQRTKTTIVFSERTNFFNKLLKNYCFYIERKILLRKWTKYILIEQTFWEWTKSIFLNDWKNERDCSFTNNDQTKWRKVESAHLFPVKYRKGPRVVKSQFEDTNLTGIHMIFNIQRNYGW